jgi:hypothetical protein
MFPKLETKSRSEIEHMCYGTEYKILTEYYDIMRFKK